MPPCHRNIKALILLITLALSPSQILAADRMVEATRCYGYLTELVRSSNFPFASIDKAKINLIIDEDEGTRVSARVVLATNGTGTLGWIQYDAGKRELLNTSAQLETPEALIFDAKWAGKYEHCIRVP